MIRCVVFRSMLFAILFCVASTAQGDDDVNDGGVNVEFKADIDAAAEIDESPGEPLPVALPSRLPDGRSLYPIGIYQSQMVELIPDDYRPASINALRDAIVRLTDRATDDQASRLRGSEYWIKYDDGVLVSDRSVIDLESDRDTIVRRSLGRVNLSIESSGARTNGLAMETYPRLESSSDGNLVAVFRGGDSRRTRLEFRWRLSGRPFRSGQEYTLRLPRTPQTRLVLALPSSLTVEALDGVLRSRPGPPNDAGDLSIAGDNRWYELDAGGLSTIRLRVTDVDTNTATEQFVLRRGLSRYDIDASGMTWSRRMVVQLPAEQMFPPLRVYGATVTSIRVNDSEVNYQTKSPRRDVHDIQIDSPILSTTSVATSTTVTVTGQSTWDGTCVLPLASWVGDRVVHAFVSDEVQVSVAEPLSVVSWQLPSSWSQLPSKTIDGATMLSASGPSINPVTTSPLPAAGNPSAGDPSAEDGGVAWSRIRLVERSPLRSTETLLRLEADKGSVTANARFLIDVDPNHLEPFRVSVQPSFSIDSVTLFPSGRLIETPNLNDRNRSFVVWPSPEDLSTDQVTGQSQIILAASGTRVLSANTTVANSQSVSIPATWFAKIQNARGTLFASIVAPTNLNWSGEAALARGRIRAGELEPSRLTFLSGGDRPTLYFKPSSGRTPEIWLEPPGVAFDVSTKLKLQRDNDEIVERLIVDVESAGQSLRELVIQTDDDAARPPFLWSISGDNGLPSTSLPASDIRRGTGEELGTYRIDVSELNLRRRPLIARRRYSVSGQVKMMLPSVPGAVSQQSEVQIGAGLVVADTSRFVQRVPLVHPDQGQRSDQTVKQESATVPSPNRDAVVVQCLRYDAVEQPSIVIASDNSDHLVNLAWRESIRVIASSRGTDRIEAAYRLTASAPITIDYSDDLQLASVHRNGQPIDLLTVPQRPLRIEPGDDTETLRVVWNRSRIGSRWLRQCRMPNINVSAVVMKRDYRLIAASDTFAPASLLTGSQRRMESDPKSIRSVPVRPGEQVTLIRRNVALAIGWLVAIFTFAVGWAIAAWRPLMVAVAVVILAAITLLWWPWKLAIIGWLIVPIIAAGMLVSARAWTRRGSILFDAETIAQNVDHDPDASKDFSWAAIVRFWLLWTTVPYAVLHWTSARADDVITSPNDPLRSEASAIPSDIGFLVPMDVNGKMTGDTVYLPRSVHSQLFQTERSIAVQSPNLQSADYRVRILAMDYSRDVGSSAGSESAIGTIVEAEYVLHLIDGGRGNNQVRLPLMFASVRRVELIDDVDRIIRFTADSQGFAVASLPKGQAFRLRVTLLATRTRLEPWNRLRLAIPSVACSRLTIESEQNVDAVRVGGTRGRLLTETDLRRWVTELGPSETLEIDYRVGNVSDPVNSQPLRRRYWVSAGKAQSIIECEIDATVSVAAGETFQFVIRDSAMPVVTSPNWRLMGSELYSPTRRLVTVAATRDAAGPIRLLWTRTRQIDLRGSADFESIALPEVVAAALGDNAPAWVALHCDPQFRLAPMETDLTEPLSVDQFMAAWSGYRGLIDRAIVATGSLPTPQLRRDDSTPSTTSQRHHLHVSNDQLELQYDATLVPGDQNATTWRLSVPRWLELIRLSVNGVEIDTAAFRNGNVNEYTLNDLPTQEPITISATAIQTLPKNLQFEPPRMHLVSSRVVDDQYAISRDPSAMIRELKSPSVAPLTGVSAASADSLSKGWIQVSNFVLTPEQSETFVDSLDGRYVVKPRRIPFDCRQLIMLSREDARWKMESRLRFDGQAVPDFIDVEIPTRWCDQLEVSPATSWSRQPSTDPLLQIIRIRCEADELRGQPLVIVGTLQNTEAGRVAVPNVRVLGLGNRRVHVAVPDRLTSDAIQWRTSAVESVGVPEIWQNEITNRSSVSTYLAASSTWSIELAPLPTINSEAVALTQDTQTFPQADGMLVVSRWDLFPGGLESIEIQIPDGGVCLGAWSAGRTSVIETVRSDETQPQQEDLSKQVIRMPLSISRLSQSIEVLVRVPVEVARKGTYVPKLLDIPVTQNWLSVHEPDEWFSESVGSFSARNEELNDAQQQRLVSLARSTVESIEHAVDIVAERPVNEVAAWLAPWAQRYRRLAEAAGHDGTFAMKDQDDMESNSAETDGVPLNLDRPIDSESQANGPSVINDEALNDTAVRADESTVGIGDENGGAVVADHSGVKQITPSPSLALPNRRRVGVDPKNQLQWRLLDDRIAVYIERYPVDPTPLSPAIFSVGDYDGYRLGNVSRLATTTRLPSIGLTSTNDVGLRNLMLNLLTLALVTGLLVCLRPFRRFAMPVVVHPAFWLALMGLFGFAVAPMPVAAAMLLCAVALPAFPGKSRLQNNGRRSR